MKRKILYIVLLVVIAMTTFFIGFCCSGSKQDRLEMIECTQESTGQYIELTDGKNFYSFWIPETDSTEKIQKAIDSIEYWEVTDNGLKLWDFDGNTYEWK